MFNSSGQEHGPWSFFAAIVATEIAGDIFGDILGATARAFGFKFVEIGYVATYLVGNYFDIAQGGFAVEQRLWFIAFHESIGNTSDFVDVFGGELKKKKLIQLIAVWKSE